LPGRKFTMRKTKVEIDKAHGASLAFYRLGNGKPRILVTGAIHGDEVIGTYAMRKVISLLDRRTPRGSVMFLPIANPLAFRCRERASPVDGADLNRIFPGNQEGSVSERLAHRIWQEAMASDYVLDLHGCGMSCTPYVLCLHQEFDFIRRYVRKLAVPTVVESSGLRGQLFIEASHKKIPAAIIEAGSHRGVLDVDHADKLRNAMLGLFASLGIVREKATAEQQRFFGKISGVKAEEENFFIPRIRAGTLVKKGDVLGIMSAGSKRILSPYRGIVTSIQMSGVVFPGDSVASIAEEI